ncbi:5009_t:CDS:1, partial [Acaulospora morrowiae]
MNSPGKDSIKKAIEDHFLCNLNIDNFSIRNGPFSNIMFARTGGEEVVLKYIKSVRYNNEEEYYKIFVRE